MDEWVDGWREGGLAELCHVTALPAELVSYLLLQISSSGLWAGIGAFVVAVSCPQLAQMLLLL